MRHTLSSHNSINVLITGATGGLGRAMAIECARRGWSLYLTDLNQTRLDIFAEGLRRRFGQKVMTQACDLSCDEDTCRLVQAIDDGDFHLNMLLNVAGLDHEGGFLDIDRQKILSIVSVDVLATLRLTHALLSRHRRPEPFYLLFVSSLASFYPMPLKATYAASKRFLLDLSIALSSELEPQGIQVMALCPAGLATTPQAIQGILAQGLAGDLTTSPLESMVRKTIDRLLAGHRLYIPGTLNKGLKLFGSLLPAQLVSALIFRRWNKAQRQWLGNPSEQFDSTGRTLIS